MAERNIRKSLRDSVVKAGIYLAEFTNLRAKPVDLQELIDDTQKYESKFVKTAGFYQRDGEKRGYHVVVQTGDNGPWSSRDFLPQYYVTEPGRLYLSDEASARSLRVYTRKFYGRSLEQALSDEQDTSRKIEYLTLTGEIKPGFPREFYLSSRVVGYKEES